jgi:hypothetical protein
MDQIEKFLEDFFTKKITYKLPENAKEVIVKIAPWVTIIVLVMALPAILAIFGLGSYFAGMAAIAGVGLGPWYYLGLIVLVAQVVLMAISVPGLLNKTKKGWQFIYYSNLVSAVHSVFFSYNLGGIIWALLGSAIGFYLIFQIKSYYK